TTVFNSTSAWTATALASSRLFMAPIVAEAHPLMHIFGLWAPIFCARRVVQPPRASARIPSDPSVGNEFWGWSSLLGSGPPDPDRHRRWSRAETSTAVAETST